MSEESLILQAIKDLKQENKEAHGKLEAHAEKTNGRVKSLEVWRGFIVGGLTIIGIMIPVLIKVLK